MDASSFAKLAQPAAATSRRRTLKSAFASALAGLGVASLRGVEETTAKKKKRKKQNGACIQCVLSSAAESPSRPIPAIDAEGDFTVFLNGQILFEDPLPQNNNSMGPLIFSARPGDRLRIVAFNNQPYCDLDPLFLHCGCREPRKLTDGVVDGCPGIAVGEYFNETFTI